MADSDDELEISVRRPFRPFARSEAEDLTLSRSDVGESTCGKPFRLFRCCFLGILLPILCIFIPLHAKYISYHAYEVPLAATDMKVLDRHMSTSWCQKQSLVVNTSRFEAFLVEERPHHIANSQPVSMLRHFTVSDDTKEYWGFYLLKGSTITISSCTGRFGANLLIIKGRKSLQYCAYVGEESTEETDSSEEAVLRRLNPRLANVIVHSKTKPAPESGKISQAADPSSRSDANPPRNTPISDNSVTSNIVDKVTKFKRAVQSEMANIYETAVGQPEGSVRLPGWYSDKEGEAENRRKRRVLEPPPEKGAVQITSSEEGTEPFQEFSGEAEDPKLFSLRRQKLVADGIADDKGGFNFTNDDTDSNSEEGSSFSSSEEALLKCDGVILYLPLIPDASCVNQSEPIRNEISYTVKEDEYYYFIYSSDNEKFSSHISARFTINRVVYDIPSPVTVCANSTRCEFGLRFGSDEKVVLSLPTPDSNVSQAWDEVYIVRSECEPRVSMYLGFFLTAPILFMFFAFA